MGELASFRAKKTAENSAYIDVPCKLRDLAAVRKTGLPTPRFHRTGVVR